MSGIDDLELLIQGMSPRLNEGCYVWATVRTIPMGVTPVATIVEDEGISIVIDLATATNLRLVHEFPSAWITLQVHSALDAVGLTATFATALADAGISCNAVAGAKHDHLFVPYDERHRALEVLAEVIG
ncbi:ACT domain-containing protein [Demequina capsici]|uniref:ACT domain-containing protein n=1 Tax=Demequina capsici TaxID=3075620 RepID=A0AA96JBW6_9MICO|nr:MULTISPECIES: ACT domain-containing protein [unclassified Demequina]WNM23283.1 ACT domain-containing protein [Demequina sp. OYTSA14]WNM26161.1 ACT domain-containing protein [Demequina sp. PMTSA13]